LPSIWDALQWCGAERLGHGVRIVDDITVQADGSIELGRLASLVRDRRVPLEMCTTSNVQTGAVAPVEEHRSISCAAFGIGHSQDNRLMSGVTMTSITVAFGIGLDEMEWLINERDEERLRPVRRAARDHQ
jgi:adenosine deaminase